MNVYQSICNAMADIEPIAKERKNREQGFSFRGIDDVMNELQPVLKKHGLFVVPKVANVIRQEKPTKSGGMLLYSIVTMEFTMYAQDGTSITGSTVGEGMDSGDKASNKAMAVAMKYFLLQTFCIPTEDEKDPDQNSYQVAPPAPAPKAPAVHPDQVEFDNLQKALVEYLNDDSVQYFEHPENVLAVIATRNLENMRRALKVAKDIEANIHKQPAPAPQPEQYAIF